MSTSRTELLNHQVTPVVFFAQGLQVHSRSDCLLYDKVPMQGAARMTAQLPKAELARIRKPARGNLTSFVPFVHHPPY